MIDLKNAGHVQVEVGELGTLWVNVDGECRFRSQGHQVLQVKDHRPSEKLSLRRFAWRDDVTGDSDDVERTLLNAVEQWALTSDEVDELVRLQVGDTFARSSRKADGEIITRVR